MRLTATIQGDLRDWAKGEVRKGRLAVTQGVRSTGLTIKERWRGQIAAAGFSGNIGRLQKSVRQDVFPKRGASLNAATTIYPQGIGVQNMMAAVETGKVVRSANGYWLAIPLPAAGRVRGGKKPTVGEWEKKKGRRLEFVYLKRNHALLVDTGRYSRPRDQKRRGKWSVQTHAPGYRNGDVTKHQTIFVLVPQVRLRKRLSVYAMAAQVGATLPARVAALWRD